VVAKCAAKIVEAYNKKDPKIILTCTDKEHICTCADCLPSSIAAWLKKALGCASTSVLRGSHAYATSGCDASGQAQEDNDLELSVNDCTDVVSVRFNFVRCCDGCRASTYDTNVVSRCVVLDCSDTQATMSGDSHTNPVLLQKCSVRLLALHNALLNPQSSVEHPQGDSSSSSSSSSSQLHSTMPMFEKCNCGIQCIGKCLFGRCIGVCV
jgi:hypothetical protein